MRPRLLGGKAFGLRRPKLPSLAAEERGAAPAWRAVFPGSFHGVNLLIASGSPVTLMFAARAIVWRTTRR